MKNKEMDKLIAHFDTYFQQSNCTVIHPIVNNGIHIDLLLYPPNNTYPYWKMVTMGASDIQMKNASSLGDRNEYIMFVDKNEDLKDLEIINWYREKLLTVALYPYYEHVGISYGHSIEWEPEENEEMVVCLQVVLLTREETEHLLEIGPGEFSSYLYPEDGGKKHFLCEHKRSSRF